MRNAIENVGEILSCGIVSFALFVAMAVTIFSDIFKFVLP